MDWDNLIKWSTQFSPLGDKIVDLIDKYKWQIIGGVAVMVIIIILGVLK